MKLAEIMARIGFFASQKLELNRVLIVTSARNNQPVTHATSKLGNWFNLKMVLFLIHLFLTERLRIFNPSLLVARGRWRSAYKILNL
jgi:hypothetical protein